MVFLKPDVLLPLQDDDLERLEEGTEYHDIAKRILELQSLVGPDISVAGHLINVRQ